MSKEKNRKSMRTACTRYSTALHFRLPQLKRANFVCLLMLTWMFAANPTFAGPWTLSAGTGMDDRNNVRVARQWHWQTRWLEGSLGHLSGYWEASIAATRVSDSAGPLDDGANPAVMAAIAPVLRWQFPALGSAQIAPFVDLGTGIALFSDKDIRKGAFRSRRMGSYLQFENRANVGVNIGDRWSIAYQQLHYSNADIASRNDGLDLFMLSIGYDF